LSLGQNKLDGEIPKEIGDLTKLKLLDLGENKLTEPVPNIMKLIELTYLNLDNLLLKIEDDD
jgi:Leucine-rich repeat (LRR) protein|tara:strand:- start:1817 stop:2002 length:186 start_codon:yes stop_codon:yes gene_type:complete